MRRLKLCLLLGLFFASACGVTNPTRSIQPTIQVIIASPTPLPSNTPVPLPTETLILTTTQAAAASVILDGFEASQTAWTAGTEAFFPDSSATSLALTGEHATQGKQALQLNFELNDKPKAIFFIDQPFDLSQAHYLQFDLYNPGSLASVGIAFQTGPDKIWYESDGIPVGAGKQASLSYDLTAGTYKAASTNWEFRATLADLNAVSRLAIILYPAQSGSVFIDNLRTSDMP